MEKYIHYCWFGKAKLPKLAKKCIKSWKKYLPDYQIIEWNESNFDVNLTKFSKGAYEEKKWAFVSDVARIYALKKMGGIYFDTDMMITKEIDSEMLESNFFVGWESDINVAVGVLGAKKGNEIINKLYKIYEEEEFDSADLFRVAIPRLLTDLLREEYDMKNEWDKNQILKEDTHIYARDYFYPMSSDTSLEDMFTDRTCMIHYYSGSWLPRDHQLQMKFNQMFGKKLGSFILRILVKGKHILKRLKRYTKKTLKVLLYPLVKIRRKIYQRRLINLRKEKNGKSIEKIKNNYVVFYNEEWIGIKNATIELFGDSAIAITELYDDEVVEYIVDKLKEKNLEFIAFSGFANGWDKLAKRLKKENSNIVIKVIWHGSICMNIYDYDYTMFKSIFNLLRDEKINSIAFVKKSMYDFFKKKGYNVEFIANNVKIKYDIQKEDRTEADNKNVRVGIYASGDRWVKNFYNQLAATSMIENCIVDCIPVNSKVYELAKIFKVKVRGSKAQIGHQELIERMAKNDINMYVTFSECAPIIPLESLEVGVPCITGNNHHYFDGTKLQEYLVVDRIDDVNSIYENIKKCLENKEEILSEYAKWKENNNVESERTVKEFLSH